MTTTVVWEHDEYDASGQLVARYKSYEQVSPAGEMRCGWQKFDAEGQVIGASQTP
jgi:hypothetical protein